MVAAIPHGTVCTLQVSSCVCLRVRAATVFTGGIGLAVAGTASGVTSTLSTVGCTKTGVYANGTCLVVRAIVHGDGQQELYFAIEESIGSKGEVTQSKVLKQPEVQERKPHQNVTVITY